ncbi:RNA-directed DNA polymerase [Salinimonas marina]|uniref:RNA-directed DNA polymerase n=1 Tax=Salinimonas marina TaxID=2785918 RepID=A0A7S9DY31_9ALTE|nr:reverse transcriptase family protein [Salinimonas marina]QPG05733.1 RNA-directed DNA polymerase [Salinimonas marina]
MDRCSYINSPISSLSSLSKTLGEDISQIVAVADAPASEKYNKPKTPVFKKDKTERIVRSPVRALRSLQYRINKQIMVKGVSWPSYLFGSIPKGHNGEVSQDYIAAAKVHCGAKSLCCLDISDFFDNIHACDVFAVFNELFHFSTEVSTILTKLVTFDERLVQGALTSSYLAMLVLWKTEPGLVEALGRKNINYSRLVDDITLSTKKYNYNFSYEVSLIEKTLHEKGLFFNEEKAKVYSVSSELMLVHGLNVMGKNPAMPRYEARRIRAAVRQLEKLAEQEGARCEMWYRREYNRCQGRVYKLERFGKSNSFRNLLNRLQKITPLPSKKDITYAKLRVKKLESDFNNVKKRETYNYMRRFSIASHRVAFLKGYYDEEWKKLRTRLKAIFPDYRK